MHGSRPDLFQLRQLIFAADFDRLLECLPAAGK